MSFLNKIEAKLPSGLTNPQGVKALMTSLYQVLGNKIFLRDLEGLLETKLIDLTPREDEALLYLARALKEIQTTDSQPSWKKW